MNDLIHHKSLFYVFGTIVFTVYGQVTLKWQIARAGTLPNAPVGKAIFLLELIASNMWVLSSLASAFLASLCWMAAVSKLDLSYAYPFMSLSFIIVLILSTFAFNEPMTIHKIVGLILIISGIIVSAQSR